MTTAVTTIFQVRGFQCAGCSETLGRSLGRMEGVIRVRADHETGRVEVRFDSARVTEEALRELIEASGFEAR